MSKPPFKKILVANRGEIACRVMRTCKRMGIATVAVYSEADRDALHVQMADEAVEIGPAPAAQSYLSVARIVEACKKTGADAVHPGYGFLSENSEFQKALAKAKITFIGPDARAIHAMGDKIESKKLAEKAGVNSVPGHLEALSSPAEAAKIAGKIGYPVMVKASAGGGGKGMRLVRNAEELKEGFASARNEARSSFGDDRIFIEKFIENPKHIEIQVLGDEHGNVIHLGERECSIQRRHQKVIEEAPSPFVTPKLRAEMGAQAVALAKAVKYKSAGTVEFIADPKGNFYFLEMNTRLQVEHPVTELVYGLDLVEWMIRIAAGEKLTIKQDDVKPKGWAIEARIYAEDPFRGFLPSVGRLNTYLPPPEGNGIRLDAGVIEGDEIGFFYDPMIGKLCGFGATREQAVAKLGAALDSFVIQGLDHNIVFLSSLVAHPRFRKGDLSTGFIAEEYPKGFTGADPSTSKARVLAAVAAVAHMKRTMHEGTISGRVKSEPMPVSGSWVVSLGTKKLECEVTGSGGAYRVKIGNVSVPIVTDWQVGMPLFTISLEGEDFTVQIERRGIGYRLQHGGYRIDATVLSPRAAELNALMPKKVPPDLSRFLLSPMPGLLVSVAAKEGQEVKQGEPLAVVEAMKMENVLKASRDGVVAKLHAKDGDSLSVDQKILEFK